MSEILVQVTRGPIIESIHRGDIVVVDVSGNIIKSIGDPHKLTYIRSAGKPLQALNVAFSGAMKRFGFTKEEIAIMCASHYGEAFHQRVILSMLEKCNLTLEALHCGTPLSINSEIAKQQISERVTLMPYHSDCSGKHVGMLATCLIKGYDISRYTEETHPVQQDIVKVVAEMCLMNPDEILMGIDGCSVPVHAMPLYNMALGYARLSNPEQFDDHIKSACRLITDAMIAAPEMLAGTGGFCTELMKHSGGKLVGKLGAEGVYCIGLIGKGVGIAVKIEDGNYSRALSPAVMKCLQDLAVLSPEEMDALKHFAIIENINALGQKVGEVSAAFKLY